MLTIEEFYAALADSHSLFYSLMDQNAIDRLQLTPVSVDKWLWIGGMAEAADVDFLKSKGITHILNCADETARGWVTPAHRYLQLNAMDLEGYSMIDRHWAEVSAFLDDALESGGKVLVHCHMGMNRSVTMALAYLFNRFRIDILSLAEFIGRNRPGALTNDTFIQQLVEWYDAHL